MAQRWITEFHHLQVRGTDEHSRTICYQAGGTDVTPPTSAEFITVQSVDDPCQHIVGQLGQAGTEFTLNNEGVLFICAPIDGPPQILEPQSQQQPLLNLSDHSPLSGHP